MGRMGGAAVAAALFTGTRPPWVANPSPEAARDCGGACGAPGDWCLDGDCGSWVHGIVPGRVASEGRREWERRRAASWVLLLCGVVRSSRFLCWLLVVSPPPQGRGFCFVYCPPGHLHVAAPRQGENTWEAG